MRPGYNPKTPILVRWLRPPLWLINIIKNRDPVSDADSIEFPVTDGRYAVIGLLAICVCEFYIALPFPRLLTCNPTILFSHRPGVDDHFSVTVRAHKRLVEIPGESRKYRGHDHRQEQEQPFCEIQVDFHFILPLNH